LTQALAASIWKEIHHLLPMKTIYLADKNALMAKNLKRDCALSIKNTDLLLEMNCKLIVVACNTATNAIRELRAKYDIPLV
jgi:glutamate racemase